MTIDLAQASAPNLTENDVAEHRYYQNQVLPYGLRLVW